MLFLLLCSLPACSGMRDSVSQSNFNSRGVCCRAIPKNRFRTVSLTGTARASGRLWYFSLSKVRKNLCIPGCRNDSLMTGSIMRLDTCIFIHTYQRLSSHSSSFCYKPFFVVRPRRNKRKC